MMKLPRFFVSGKAQECGTTGAMACRRHATRTWIAMAAALPRGDGLVQGLPKDGHGAPASARAHRCGFGDAADWLIRNESVKS